MNATRRLAFFTAVNIDGGKNQRKNILPRTDDTWYFDPRIAAEAQIGDALYDNDALDRGHLVRRLDPAWGITTPEAQRANDDTFHWTNCSPQHHTFNTGKTLWAGLEDYILDNADKNQFRASVFSGPVFSPDDPVFRGVALPRQFWKVAAIIGSPQPLSVTAYLLSQGSFIEGLRAPLPTRMRDGVPFVARAEPLIVSGYATYFGDLQKRADPFV